MRAFIPAFSSMIPGPTNPSGLTLKFTYWEAVEELLSIRANSERSEGIGLDESNEKGTLISVDATSARNEPT
jgi:hypothetical protein